MMERGNIRNAALLRPGFCKSMKQSSRHAFVAVPSKSYEQCVDCGKIKREDNNYGLRTGQLHNRRTDSGISR